MFLPGQINTRPGIPNNGLFAIGRSKNVLVLPVPFYLCPSLAPRRHSHERLVPCPEIPTTDAAVHRNGRHEVWIEGMPLYIGDGACMGVYTAM